jgi:hypothetical protein
MGSRRLGRKRLFSLDKRGEKLSASQIGTGTGMKDAFVRANKTREGSIVTVEMVYDLGTADAVVASFGANDVIGVTGESGTIFVATTAIFGYLLELEMCVLETPTTGDDDLHIYSHTTHVNAAAAGAGNTNTAVDITTAVIGNSNVQALNGATFAVNNHFYIVSDGSTTGTYATGKLLIRATGFVIDDGAASSYGV